MSAISTAAQAHHGWSSYDQAKPVKITAKVITLKWENPHGEITVTHKGVEWSLPSEQSSSYAGL